MTSDPQPDWACIVDKHAERVYRIAFRILGSVQEAEDVSQNVFAEAVRLYKAGPVQSWLGLFVRLASLRAIDLLRTRRKTLQLEESDYVSHRNPTEEAIGTELSSWLREAIGRLPGQQATVFSLTFFDQLDRLEIADILGLAPDAVSACLYKARKRLQSELHVLTRGEK